MRMCLIDVPSASGESARDAARGPGRLLDAGLVERLAARGAAVSRVSAAAPAGPAAVRDAVAFAVADGALPVVLAGSCDTSVAVAGGIDRDGCAVVWIDAHADFMTPETSPGASLDEMALAVLCGHCREDVRVAAGVARPVPEEAVVLLGVRELGPDAERERLERSSIGVVGWRDGGPVGDVDACLDATARTATGALLHIDLDALDPAVAPGVSRPAGAGGLSARAAENVVRAVAGRMTLRAVTLAAFVPGRDVDDRTLDAALRVLDAVAEVA